MLVRKPAVGFVTLALMTFVGLAGLPGSGADTIPPGLLPSWDQEVGGPCPARLSNTVFIGGAGEFTPKNINITVGDTVLWWNAALGVHTSTENYTGFNQGFPRNQINKATDLPLWDSSLIPPGQTQASAFVVHFCQVASYDYHCDLHFQRGTVNVLPAA